MADQSNKFVIPKMQTPDNSQFSGSNRGHACGGGRGGNNRGRGGLHGNQTNSKPDSVKDNHNTFPRGGGRGRGGRGKKN